MMKQSPADQPKVAWSKHSPRWRPKKPCGYCGGVAVWPGDQCGACIADERITYTRPRGGYRVLKAMDGLASDE